MTAVTPVPALPDEKEMLTIPGMGLIVRLDRFELLKATPAVFEPDIESR
jgi:hypothetical protein